MSSLEHRIPPPVVALVAAVMMWLIAQYSSSWDVPAGLRWGGIAVLAVCGFAVDISALVAFRRARTTVNPLAIDRATRLVTDGPFKFTRNPMYLGMVFLLAAWMFYLRSPASILGIAAFAFYITRFQIRPEEKIMVAKFGADFEAYRNRVRRWI